MRHLNQDEVIRISRSRAMNETWLCKRMYEVYNRGEIITKLRSFIGTAIEQICVMATSGGVDNEIRWTGAIREAGANLVVWRHGTGAGKINNVKSLMGVLKQSGQWTAADCSDLIRLFGGIIENPVLQNYGEVDAGVDKFRDQQRFGAGFKAKGPGAQRARERGAYYPQNTKQTKLPHISAAHDTVLRQKRAAGFSGIAKTTLKDCSTVKKIDSTFGLAEGCDISGTTADSIFFMKHVHNFFDGLPEDIPDDLMPIIQLLPLATMGSQGHHTVLECALTLTLNGIMRYRVGFYRTLRPVNGMLPASIAVVLNAAETSLANKHILCYWEGGQLRGIQYDKAWEISQLRMACLAHGAFRHQFHMLPLQPTAKELFRLPIFTTLPK